MGLVFAWLLVINMGQSAQINKLEKQVKKEKAKQERVQEKKER